MDIKSMIEEYIEFLRQNISYRQIEKGYEITTPFLDDNNDCIQIYVDDIQGEKIKLSDDGATISTLLDGGIKLTQTRRQLIYSVAAGYGVEVEDNELTIECKIRDFAQKKHALLQAILKIGDIGFTSQSRVASMFTEDVEEYFKSYQVSNMKNMSVIGKSGFIHTYDFVLPGDNHFSERFCNALNKPTKSNVSNMIFSWQDTIPQRKHYCEDGKFYVFMNDDNNYSSKLEDALIEYNLYPIRKSEMSQSNAEKYFKKSA